MKIAILSESPVDDAVLRVLVEAILGDAPEAIPVPFLRTRNWPSVLNDAPKVMQHLHYWTDAQGLVVVADSNHKPVHDKTHDQIEGGDSQCRLCQLRTVATKAQHDLSPMAGRRQLGIAIGLAVPTLEAWLRCGADTGVSESSWINGLRAGTDPYSKVQLKRAVYGTDRAPLLDRAIAEAHRVAADIDGLLRAFPNGFGSMYREVKSWLDP